MFGGTGRLLGQNKLHFSAGLCHQGPFAEPATGCMVRERMSGNGCVVLHCQAYVARAGGV